MTWFALVDDREIRISPRGLRPQSDPVTSLARGTLLFDLSPDTRRFARRLLSLGPLTIAWRGQNALHIDVGGRPSTFETDDLNDTGGLLALTWDRALNTARLIYTRPGQPQAKMHALACPDFRDVAGMRDALTSARFLCDPQIACLAVSDRIEPIFPLPGLTGETMIHTDQGPRPIADIRAGTRVHTMDGQRMPVLEHVTATLPARGSLAPATLGLTCFGIVSGTRAAPYQGVGITGSFAEYTFARERVSVPFGQLAAYGQPAPATSDPLVTYHQLLLPDAVPMISGDGCVMSLYIARLRRDRALLAHSLLADIPRDRLPEHRAPHMPRLSPSEARAFVHARVA